MKALPKRDSAIEWFSRADLRAYEGLYVAFVGSRVAASGKDARKVYAQARRRFPGREIVLWKAIKEDMLLL